MSLLPSNATELEKALEQAIIYNVDPNILSDFKSKATGNLNLALSWEYSLSQINVDDFRTRVIEGLKFHRLQGTPYSLKQAFSWHGFNNIEIEEEDVGKHFAEFQVGVKEIPNNLDVEKFIEVSEIAAPLRSRLSRIYNDLYDIRRFVLDESDWGYFLSDHSGNQFYADSPKFSFGRVNNFDAATSRPSLEGFNVSVHYAYAEKVDVYRLDWTILDETEEDTLCYDVVRHACRYRLNTNFILGESEDIFKARTIAKALPVLSEDAVLGDINTCFSGGYEHVDEQPITLDYSKLSEHPVTRNQVLVSYRDYRNLLFFGSNADNYSIIRGNKTNPSYFEGQHNYTIKAHQQRYRFDSVSAEYKIIHSGFKGRLFFATNTDNYALVRGKKTNLNYFEGIHNYAAQSHVLRNRFGTVSASYDILRYRYRDHENFATNENNYVLKRGSKNISSMTCQYSCSAQSHVLRNRFGAASANYNISRCAFRGYTNFAEKDSAYEVVRGNKTNISYFSCQHNCTTESYGETFRFVSTKYEGNNEWHDQTHFDVPWNEQKNYIGRII